MTARQADFIRTLVRERNCDALSNDQQEFLRRVLFEGVDLSPAQASRVIEKLLTLPYKNAGRGATTTPAPTVDVAEGRYAIVDAEDGRIRFFRVDRPTEGRWAGRTFVKEQASDEHFPVRGPRANEVLVAIAADPARAMRRYASELGRCGYCGRTLTDETSRAAGIGPDCADRHGIDRSVWAERAMAEAAARVRGEETTAAPTQEPLSGPETIEETGEGENLPPAPAAPENAAHAAGEAYSGLRAAAGRPDPANAVGWRERRARVDEQQGRTSTGERRATSQLQTLPGTTWEDIFGMGGRA